MSVLDRVRAAYPPAPSAEVPAATVDRLRAAYAESVPVRARRARRGWPSRRVGLFAVVGLIVCATAVAATTGGWHPILGSDHPGARPRPARSPVPAAELAALAVLRRPQTAIDRGPLVRRALRTLNRDMVDGIHTDAIRVIFQRRREVSVLVPAQSLGTFHGLKLPAERNVLCLLSSSYQRARTIRLPKGRVWHVRAGYNSWGFNCGGLSRLRTTGIQTGTSPDGSGGLVVNHLPTHVVFRKIVLVPDGVARVTAHLPGHRVVTVAVHDNTYRFTVRGLPSDLGTVWYDAAGRRIDHRTRDVGSSG